VGGGWLLNEEVWVWALGPGHIQVYWGLWVCVDGEGERGRGVC
jgi:hypothetical protein